MKNQKGNISLIFLIAIVGIVFFVLLTNVLGFKGNLLGSLFGKPSSFASGIVDLSLVPSQVTVSSNDTFNVDISMDAKTEQVTAAEIHITFDPQKLQPLTFQVGSFLPLVLSPGSFGTGTATITLATNPGSPKSGVGVLGSLTFKALQATATPSAITIDPTTQVSAIGKTDSVIGNLGSSQVTIDTTQSTNKTANFSLSPAIVTQDQQVEFPVAVKIQTDSLASNVFSAKFNFDSSTLQVTRIDTTGNSFVTDAEWVERFFDNSLGKISITAAIPAPGFKTAGSAVNYAIIYFKGKSAGTSTLSFLGTSVVYDNAGNTDILNTPSNGTITITNVQGTTPPPPPPPANNPPPPPVTPPPPPSQGGQACDLQSASWKNITTTPVDESTLVTLQVISTGDCTGKHVSYEVLEDDSPLGGTDPVKTNPATSTLSGSNIAESTWMAEYQPDGVAGIFDPPEYIFKATLEGSATSITSSGIKLQVNKPNGSTVLKGDINHDGKVDLQDLSIMLSNWNRNQDLIDEIDLSDDGIINAFDYVLLLAILRSEGVIAGP